MKNLIICIVALAFTHSASAQVMQAKAVWATLSVPQMKCWECRDRLEKYLTREKGPNDDAGLMKWNINMTSGTVRIEYVPDRITLDYIKTAINNAGYDVDNQKATPDSYNKLPPICKRADDGGGQLKGQAPCKLPPSDRQ